MCQQGNDSSLVIIRTTCHHYGHMEINWVMMHQPTQCRYRYLESFAYGWCVYVRICICMIHTHTHTHTRVTVTVECLWPEAFNNEVDILRFITSHLTSCSLPLERLMPSYLLFIPIIFCVRYVSGIFPVEKNILYFLTTESAVIQDREL